MKAILTGTIDGIYPKTEDGLEKGDVEIMLTFTGKADTKMLNAKEVIMNATLCIKRALADDIKFGDVFTCELSVGPKEE